jgi:hypothetical protein
MTSASGTVGFDLTRSFDAARAGQAQVEQHGINALNLQQAIGVLGGIGNVGDEAQGQRDLAASVADGAFIVDDEEVQEICGHDLRSGEDVGYGD